MAISRPRSMETAAARPRAPIKVSKAGPESRVRVESQRWYRCGLEAGSGREQVTKVRNTMGLLQACFAG